MDFNDASPSDAGGILALKDKFIVHLRGEQHQELERLAATGKRSVAIITRARILLNADANADGLFFLRLHIWSLTSESPAAVHSSVRPLGRTKSWPDRRSLS